jgi:hypothetical protein
MRTAITPLGEHDFQVPSDTRPGVRYLTTRFSCTCPGFLAHGGAPDWTCRHVRAVRKAYGMPLVMFKRRPAVSDDQTAA